MAYTNPAYQTIKALAAQAASYDDALNKAQELKATRDQLLSKRNTFSATDLQKVQRMLPDNVDNIRLIIDINNVAARHSLTLSGVQLGEISDTRSNRNAAAIGSSGSSVGSVSVSFSVTATYDVFQAFLRDLEHSLRIVDVERLTFTAGASPAITFNLSIRTYWLR